MQSIRQLGNGLVVGAVLSLLVGCGGASGTASKGGPKAEKSDKSGKDDHAHEVGPHGGTVADWGGGKYHIEVLPERDKQELTIYILDGNVKKAVPIQAKDGQMLGSITGLKDKAAFEVILKAAPQAGDPEGKASRFVGKHEKIGVAQEIEGTVTGEDNGTPYTGTFKTEPAKK